MLMPIDFNFDSTSTSPFTTAPSSPKIFFTNFFYSAATNPSKDPFLSCDENDEQKNGDYEEDNIDFAFDFSGQLEPPSISNADELFHGGKIKTLKPPLPRPQSYNNPSRSPRLFQGVYSKKYVQLFSEGFEHASKDQPKNPCPRGIERTPTATKHKRTQSLLPCRVSDILSDHEKVTTNQSSPFHFMWYNKWNLKNLLIFGSTSEGSAATSDGLIKRYKMITKGEQDTKNSSFRSCNGGGSVHGSSSKRMKRKVSAHEMHYTVNRAVAEGMKKKTYLPYRSGLLGC